MDESQTDTAGRTRRSKRRAAAQSAPGRLVHRLGPHRDPRRRGLRPRVGGGLPRLDGRARGRRVPARLVRHLRRHPRRGCDRRCAARARGVLPADRRAPALALARVGAARLRHPADDDARRAPRPLHAGPRRRSGRGRAHRDRRRLRGVGPRRPLGAHRSAASWPSRSSSRSCSRRRRSAGCASPSTSRAAPGSRRSARPASPCCASRARSRSAASKRSRTRAVTRRSSATLPPTQRTADLSARKRANRGARTPAPGTLTRRAAAPPHGDSPAPTAPLHSRVRGAPVRVGIARERRTGERRVAVTPETVRQLADLGLEVLVEHGAGEASGHADAAYEQAGATIVDPLDLGDLDVLRTCARSTPRRRRGCDAAPSRSASPRPRPSSRRCARSRDARRHAFALELVPRISRAQSMDALTSRRSSPATGACSRRRCASRGSSRST